MLGTNRQMGEFRRQYEALTVEQMMVSFDIAENHWRNFMCEDENKDIELVMTFMILGFCTSLRGEEVPLVAIDGLLEFLEETKAHTTPYMMITLRGNFKGENNLWWYCVPLADVTKSGIPT